MLTREIQAAIISIIFHGFGLWFMFLFMKGEKEELIKTQFNIQLLPIESQIESSLFSEGSEEIKQQFEPENFDSTSLEETVLSQPDANNISVPNKEVHSSEIHLDSQLNDKLFNVQEKETMQTEGARVDSELVLSPGRTGNVVISRSSKDWLKPKDSIVMSAVRSVVAAHLAQTDSPVLEEHSTEDSVKTLSTQTGVVSRKFKWDKLERGVIRGAKIKYPELLALNSIEADLEVQLTISAEGSVSNVTLISSSGYSSVDAEVMQSFKMQQFAAGNQKTIVSVAVEFRFLRSF